MCLTHAESGRTPTPSRGGSPVQGSWVQAPLYLALHSGAENTGPGPAGRCQKGAMVARAEQLP